MNVPVYLVKINERRRRGRGRVGEAICQGLESLFYKGPGHKCFLCRPCSLYNVSQVYYLLLH